MKTLTKTITVLILISLVLPSVYGQEPQYETIFNKNAIRELPAIRFYGILNAGYSPTKTNNLRYNFLNIGAEAGITLNKKVGVGLFYQSGEEITPVNPKTFLKDLNLYKSFDAFGLSFTATPKPQNATHLFYNLKLSTIGILDLKPIPNANTEFKTQGSFMANPSVGVEFNLSPWLATSASLGYRYVAPSKNTALDFEKSLRGLNLQLGFKVANLR